MMGKIRLNLVSGAVVEKPLINAFKSNNNSYVVFDNEMNGSMGLPIILVCKLENDKLIKIMDQGEWQVVKEYLKNIIAGNKVEFIKIAETLVADDIYYTQLTLPVPSFDALKNAYKVEEVSVQPVMDVQVQPEINVVENVVPVENVVSVEPTPVVGNVEPVVNPTEPVVDFGLPIQNVQNDNTTAIVEPAIDLNTQIPTFNNPSVSVTPEIVMPVEPTVEPEITPTPVIEHENVNVSNDVSIFKEQKEAFMLACENMFDALVQKFEKELENRK